MSSNDVLTNTTNQVSTPAQPTIPPTSQSTAGQIVQNSTPPSPPETTPIAPKTSLDNGVPQEIAQQIKESVTHQPVKPPPQEDKGIHPLVIVLIGLAIFLTGMGITMLILLL